MWTHRNNQREGILHFVELTCDIWSMKFSLFAFKSADFCFMYFLTFLEFRFLSPSLNSMIRLFDHQILEGQENQTETVSVKVHVIGLSNQLNLLGIKMKEADFDRNKKNGN